MAAGIANKKRVFHVFVSKGHVCGLSGLADVLAAAVATAEPVGRRIAGLWSLILRNGISHDPHPLCFCEEFGTASSGPRRFFNAWQI